MEGSVLGFRKTEWKVSDTDSVHRASSLSIIFFILCYTAICFVVSDMYHSYQRNLIINLHNILKTPSCTFYFNLFPPSRRKKWRQTRQITMICLWNVFLLFCFDVKKNKQLITLTFLIKICDLSFCSLNTDNII
jgi:hypothetical protein